MSMPIAKRIFVSYSHLDERWVVPVIQVLRTTGASVFRDQDTIPLGKQWRTVISEALEDADVVLVFWSSKSIESTEMRAEYEAAASLGKDIVPIVLDGTPLNEALSKYQGVDFSEMCVPHDPTKWDGSYLYKALLNRVFARP